MSASVVPLPVEEQRVPTLHDMADEELMIACADESEDAFRILVDRYSSRVLNLVTRWIGDRDRAEDLTQEVFLRVYRNRMNYRQTGKFSSWLFTIAVNLARNEMRNVKRRGSSIAIDTVTGMNESGTLQLRDFSPIPDETVKRNDLSKLVRETIMDLPNRHREILVLRDLQDLKYEEIAELLGIPGGTVRSRINRARMALKKRLTRLIPAHELAQLAT